MKPQQPNNNTNPTRGITANDLVKGVKYKIDNAIGIFRNKNLNQ